MLYRTKNCVPYFPENKLVMVYLKLFPRLYGLRIEQQKEVDVWHEDVSILTIPSNAIITSFGSFYFDLYHAKNNVGGAWMDDCRSRRRLPNGELQLP